METSAVPRYKKEDFLFDCRGSICEWTSHVIDELKPFSKFSLYYFSVEAVMPVAKAAEIELGRFLVRYISVMSSFDFPLPHT